MTYSLDPSPASLLFSGQALATQCLSCSEGPKTEHSTRGAASPVLSAGTRSPPWWCWALGSNIHAPEHRQTRTYHLLWTLTPTICIPTEPRTGSSMHAPPQCQPCTQHSALGCPGGNRHHPKTQMCTFWDGFASSPTSLGSMDIPFISC